ncbi:MAG TPA: protein kinase [Vicinamibacterales bacterium]|jgi:serine/threonine protein kinase
MALTLGTHLGPYEVGALLGAGGMGEVYRGRDPRLGRDVAIKILPPQFLTDPERLERFQREARAVAALNHPNIVAIYDTGNANGMRFIVCELLAGGTLRDVLTPGAPLLFRRSIEIARQIAHGLAAAHARGIVHRDLKPENIFVGDDGVVKILDFGLSRLKDSTSEELTTPGTEPGRILGTAGYMAPEQVLGQPADHRADIFAFGAILYEMLAGRRAFIGATSADAITAILTSEPPEISIASRPVTPELEGIVRRCLEKRPDSRFQSASDLSFALEMLSRTSSNGLVPERSSTPRTPLVRWLLGAAMIVVAAAAGALVERRFSSPPLETTHATYVDLLGPSGPDVFNWCCAVLSDDGHRVAYRVFERGTQRLWIGSLDQPSFTPIAGTDGISGWPFWSPDGQHLGFVVDAQLKTVDLITGSVANVSLVPVPTIGGISGAWNGKGDLILTSRGLFQCRSSGGPLKPLVMPDVQHHEYNLANPHFLPDEEHYLFSVARRGDEPGAIYVGKLGSDERKLIGHTDSPASYTAPGYVLFTREGTLFAQRLDPSRLELSDQPERLVDGLATSRRVFGETAVVASPTALYFRTVPDQGQYTWFDRGGRELARVGDPLPSYSFDVSADGANVVTMLGLPGYLWQIDARHGDMTRLTDGADDADPRFNADATSVLFGGTYDERRGVDLVEVHGNTRRRVYEPPRGAEKDPRDRLILHDWSRDGLTALVDLTGRHREISAVTLSNGQTRVVLRSSGSPDQARFSPDGKWVVYNDRENGRFEIFVVPFPPTGERWQLSPSGGVQPEWRADGHELFYLDSTGALTAVEVRSQPRFSAGPPRLLFHTSLLGESQADEYRAAADGQRFLLRVPVGGPLRTTLVLNWPALLNK